MKTFYFFLLLLVFQIIISDCYLHSPRGSNDRNCEKTQQRTNANRLFDSQNNAQGGYACPRAVGGPSVITPTMYYYTGSKLYIEWTNQHSCGNPNANCELILQYMCSDTAPGLRDGTPSSATDTATDSLTTTNMNDARQGSHEQYSNYQKCSIRNRNTQLFIADQNIATNAAATNTRQNANGQQYGWECQEERDYYPYWHPTPWRDIAILTTNVSRCSWYLSQSENVLGRGDCMDPTKTNYLSFNNPTTCQVGGGVWVLSPANGNPPPTCQQADWSRDNHLGNGLSGIPLNYWWTIPNTPNPACVFRIRYNVSTGDYPWDLDASKNGKASPVYQDQYVNAGYNQTFSLALNTDQYGRTFQDRSYVFSIVQRPSTVSPSTNIWNLGVRGKRGNIVDTYPAVEYDFSPQTLHVSGQEYIHFQWVGSDYNPNNTPNDAVGGPLDPVDGGARADRSNIVQEATQDVNFPRNATQVSMFLTPTGSPDINTINLLAMINQPGLFTTNPTTMCLNQTALTIKNGGNTQNVFTDSQNCMKLNNAPTPYFDGGLVMMRASGMFSYYSTRNNNFSNRSQKGVIIVTGGEFNFSPKIIFNISLLLMCLLFILL